MFNEIVVARVEYFKEKGNVMTVDTNSKPNVILIPVAGKIPNQAQVVAGSVAMSAGIIGTDGSIVNALQMLHVTERAADPEYGRQFSIGLLSGNIQATELASLLGSFGKGEVVVTKVSEATPENTKATKGATPTLSIETSEAPAAEGVVEDDAPEAPAPAAAPKPAAAAKVGK